jgi:hypothetical protein
LFYFTGGEPLDKKAVIVSNDSTSEEEYSDEEDLSNIDW